MVSKYDALADYLRQQSGPRHTMSFAQIEGLIGTPLPASSRTWSAWWGNDRSPHSSHVQSKHGWLAAGWDVDVVDQNQRTVTFRAMVSPVRARRMTRKELRVALLNGIHHLTTLTADLDRLIGFYQRVFDARVTLDLEEEGLRHAFIEVGPTTVLHPFQVPGVAVPQGALPMFGRGRLDHFAFNAASEEAFRELRRRVVAEGAADGDVIDMGSLLNFGFKDPDGASHEVVWVKPGVPVERGLRREEWTTVDLE